MLPAPAAKVVAVTADAVNTNVTVAAARGFTLLDHAVVVKAITASFVLLPEIATKLRAASKSVVAGRVTVKVFQLPAAAEAEYALS